MEQNPMELFLQEAPASASAIELMVNAIRKDSSLDDKTAHLINIGIQTSNGNQRGVFFHAMMAREAGAARNEVLGAVIMNLHLSGLSVVLDCLPHALAGFDGKGISGP